jgi:hypothetical protein
MYIDSDAVSFHANCMQQFPLLSPIHVSGISVFSSPGTEIYLLDGWGGGWGVSLTEKISKLFSFICICIIFFLGGGGVVGFPKNRQSLA